MPGCYVVGCRSEPNPIYGGISFHKVNRNSPNWSLWEKAVKINSKSARAKICSLHFKDEDFIQRCGRRCLNPLAVPLPYNGNNLPYYQVDYQDVSTDDEDDNEKLSSLKNEKISQENVYIPAEGSDKMNDSNSDDSDNDTEPQNVVMVKPKPCSKCSILDSQKKQTSNAMTQTNIKSDREVALQAKVKLLGSRLKRRDAKIGYMKTVLNMIKKHTKGTDMAYKLCCELQNISDFPDLKESKLKNKKGNIKEARVDSPAREEEVLSEEDTCTVFEVVSSPNLRPNRVGQRSCKVLESQLPLTDHSYILEEG